MSGGSDKQVIIWKTNFGKRKNRTKEERTSKKANSLKSERTNDVYSRIQQDVTTDVGAAFGQPGKLLSSATSLAPPVCTGTLVLNLGVPRLRKFQ